MNLTIIGSVWPEPNSSAAGHNMMNIIKSAISKGWKVTFVSASQSSANALDLSAYGVESKLIKLNCESFEHTLAKLKPDIVIFDRFMTEEQYSWRVAKSSPQALRVLNMEDCHGLREISRQKLHNSHAFDKNVLYRELASIMRSDLSMVISRNELSCLINEYQIPNTQLCYFPLLQEDTKHDTLGYEQRKNISFIGNFKHAPNWDAVLKLHQIWPEIKKRIGPCECHIYGAYPPPKAMQLHNAKTGFHIKGWVDNSSDAFASYRLHVCPLRFGAGIKGKLLEAMAHGTPSVTTPIGQQGIVSAMRWPGRVTCDDASFIESTVELYTDKARWNDAHEAALTIHKQNASAVNQHNAVLSIFEGTLATIEEHRDNHVLSRILNLQTVKSHQYMGQWIEAKTTLSVLRQSLSEPEPKS